MPYTKMQSLLNEYQNKEEPYQPALRVVYGNNQTIMKQEILNVDDHITYLLEIQSQGSPGTSGSSL